MVQNYMSIDFEEWFQGLSSTGRKPETWSEYESRIDIGAEFLLKTFEEYKIKATFFVVGVLAEARPDLIQRIHEQGHEIGLHGHLHQHVSKFTPKEFEADLRANINALRSAFDGDIKGFRAPAFSVRTDMPWVWEILEDCGLSYSSSLFPIRTPLYGAPDAPLTPHKRAGIHELPMSVFSAWRTRFPFSGGFYFRILPYSVVEHLTKKMNMRGIPVVCYFHPWEFDENHPKPDGISNREKISHYTGLRTTREKLEKLCSTFQFQPMENWVDSSQ